MKVYKELKPGFVLVPMYKKGLLVEMTTQEHAKLKKEIKNPNFHSLEARKTLTAPERKAFWMCGIKAVMTPAGLFRLF